MNEIEVGEDGDPSGGIVWVPAIEAPAETLGTPRTYTFAEHADGLVCVELLLLNEAEQFAVVIMAARLARENRKSAKTIRPEVPMPS